MCMWNIRTHKRNDVYWLATIVILITFISCIVNHHADLRQRLVGAQMRIACSAAIYRKSLRMSKRAVTQTSAGNVVNLLSNDVSRLDYGFILVHYIWILPIQGMWNIFIYNLKLYHLAADTFSFFFRSVPFRSIPFMFCTHLHSITFNLISFSSSSSCQYNSMLVWCP
jgi:hypothetical protein